jgi:hypothetical protein
MEIAIMRLKYQIPFSCIKTLTRKHPENSESDKYGGRFQGTLLYICHHLTDSISPENIQNIES